MNLSNRVLTSTSPLWLWAPYWLISLEQGHNVVTGTLTVIYRNPTPLNTPLTLRAWHDRTDGKKIYAKGTLHNGEVLCAKEGDDPQAPERAPRFGNED